MSQFQKSILIVLLFALSACSQNPIELPNATTPAPSVTFTPYVGGTETALAVSNATPTMQELWTATPPALPTFALTTAPTISFSPPPEGVFSPLLYGSKDSSSFLIVGGIKKDQGWLSSDQAVQFIGSEMDYDFFGSNGLVQMQGSVPEFEQPCGNYVIRSSVVMPEPMVGVASGRISEKRGVTDLSTDDPAYIQAVTEWFQSQGNSPREVHITRILQVDIEGDGVDEVLISASYFTEKFAFLTETGDYSIVLMRKVIGNNVLTFPLVKDYYISSVPEFEVSYPNTYTLVEAVDLNGDGTLEVIVDVRRWEGWGAIVYRVDGQNVREVMRAIC